MTEHIILPDLHLCPSKSLDPLRAAANLIKEVRPSKVIQIGDWGNFDSFSSHEEVGSAAYYEQPAHHEDFEICRQGADILAEGVGKHKKSPTVHITLGNHDYRVAAYLNSNPKQKGQINFLRDSGLGGRGWKVSPYGKCQKVDNIIYTHCPMSVMGRPATSDAALKQITLGCEGMGFVMGHTHRFHAPTYPVATTGSFKQAIMCGCLFEGTPPYAEKSTTGWWRGVLRLWATPGNAPEFEKIGLSELMDRYL